MATHPANPDAAERIGVAILARAPVPGQAKTRLIPLLGEEGAARLHAWMLQRTVAMAFAADVGPITLWCEGDTEHHAFIRCRELGPLRILPQVAGDLGRRMLVAVEDSPTVTGTLVAGFDGGGTEEVPDERILMFGEGDDIELTADLFEARVLVVSGKHLREPVAWADRSS